MDCFDVVIIGGGCAGLFLAEKITDSSYTCALVDKEPISGHASTRNQGWLQSGSFYAAADDTAAAAECSSGYKYIVSKYPEAVRTDVPSLCLFDRKTDLDGALNTCESLGIRMERLDSAAEHSLLASNPALQGTSLAHIAKTDDRPFDTRKLLQEVADSVTQNGVSYHRTPKMSEVQVVPDSNAGWAVKPGNEQLSTRVLVLACGVYMKEILRTLWPAKADEVNLTKTPVLVLKGERPLIHCALMVPLIDSSGPPAPNIVPFGRDGVEGVSVCLSRVDLPAADPTDEDLTNSRLGDIKTAFAMSLERHYPGIKEFVEQYDTRGHFYACQKVKNPSRGANIEFYEDEGRTLVTYYPGKFTSSPISAAKCADQIATKMEGYSTSMAALLGSRTGNQPVVARQRYYEVPRYKLRTRNNILEFEELI